MNAAAQTQFIITIEMPLGMKVLYEVLLQTTQPDVVAFPQWRRQVLGNAAAPKLTHIDASRTPSFRTQTPPVSNNLAFFKQTVRH